MQSTKVLIRRLEIGWINSDDYYLPNALKKVMLYGGNKLEENWLVANTYIQQKLFLCLSVRRKFTAQFNNVSYFNARDLPASWIDFVCFRWSGIVLPQPSSFWRKYAWENVGGLDEKFHFAMDHEFYGRLAYSGSRPKLIDKFISVFQRHRSQKTSLENPFLPDEIMEVEKWLKKPLSKDDKKILEKYSNFLLGISRKKSD